MNCSDAVQRFPYQYIGTPSEVEEKIENNPSVHHRGKDGNHGGAFSDIFSSARKNVKIKPATFSESYVSSQSSKPSRLTPDISDVNSSTLRLLRNPNPTKTPQSPPKRQKLSLATINRRKAFLENAQNTFLSGNFGELLSMSDKEIENDPSYSKVWQYKGIALAKMGLYLEAVKSLNKSISINPHSSLAYRYRGHSFEEIGAMESALEDYSMVIGKSSSPGGKAVGYKYRALLKWKMGDAEGYCSDYQKSASLNKDYAKSFESWINKPDEGGWCKEMLADR